MYDVKLQFKMVNCDFALHVQLMHLFLGRLLDQGHELVLEERRDYLLETSFNKLL